MVRNAAANSAVHRRPTRRADAPTPHPSWRQTITGADQGAGRVVSAGDFWARLGI